MACYKATREARKTARKKGGFKKRGVLKKRYYPNSKNMRWAQEIAFGESEEPYRNSTQTHKTTNGVT